MERHQEQQHLLCQRYGATYLAAPLFLKIGISRTFNQNIFPINGLRHPPEANTSGWYIWSGEFSEASDFFVPLCIEHLESTCFNVIRFLGLAPGWRFLIALNYEDVWYDPKLLDV